MEWLATWAATWGVPDLSSRVQIQFSPRIRSALGRCAPHTGAIRLNPGLLEAPPEALREVVCHEAAHAAVRLIHGRHVRPHGREWKDLMRRAGYAPRVRWAEADLPDAVRERGRAAVLFVHTCPVCRAHRVARRRVAAWRCGVCRAAGREGRLDIFTTDRRA